MYGQEASNVSDQFSKYTATNVIHQAQKIQQFSIQFTDKLNEKISALPQLQNKAIELRL